MILQILANITQIIAAQLLVLEEKVFGLSDLLILTVIYVEKPVRNETSLGQIQQLGLGNLLTENNGCYEVVGESFQEAADEGPSYVFNSLYKFVENLIIQNVAIEVV